jgi:hypothetical protein
MKTIDVPVLICGASSSMVAGAGFAECHTAADTASIDLK